MKESLSYDDILLIPSFSEIEHRSDINLRTLISKRYGTLIPIIASPMDTICEKEMAFKMFLMGGVGCIHRFMSIEEQSKQISELVDLIYGYNKNINHEYVWNIKNDWHAEEKVIPIMGAIGVKEEDKKRAADVIRAGANILLIDVAHGHHKNVINMIKWCKKNLPDFVDIIAGNIVTAEGAEDLENAGADGIRVGIGGGCFTPDMKVKTDNGLKSIKDIEIDDLVYTHTGELKPVIKKFIYNNNKEILDIDGIECTPNHMFYVIHEKYKDLINNENIHEYAKWIKADELTNEYFLIELE